jgi:hypothetical protein
MAVNDRSADLRRGPWGQMPENHRRLRVWEVNAKARAEEYDDEIADLLSQNGNLGKEAREALGLATKRLDEARTVREPDHGFWAHTGGGVAAYWTGASQEETWRAIHEADVVLTYARPAEHIRAELPGLRETVRQRVEDGLYREDLLERLKAIEASLSESAKAAKKAREDARKAARRTPAGGGSVRPSGGSPATTLTITDEDRIAVAHVKQELYKISAEGFESQRSFRNIILITALVAAAISALLAILGLFDNTLVYRLDVYPKTGRMMWPATIWPVELIGALAGFIVAITALRKLKGRGPYSLRVVQATLKVPMGALTAFAGMLLLQSGAFGIGPVTTKGEFVAWAFVFGASQELFTRLVDQKAAAVAEKAKPGG